MANIPFRERFSCSVPEALEALGIGRTKFYELVSGGAIKTRKVGTKTIVVIDSLRGLFDLPNPQPDGRPSDADAA